MFLNKLVMGALTNVRCLILFISVLVLYKIMLYIKKVRSLPPGPWGLPIIGYLPFLKGDAHISFKNLSAKYGSIFSTKLGDQLIVVLSDYRHIREAFRKEEFSGRPHTELSSILGGYELFKVVFIEIFKYSSSDNVEFTHNANALDRVQTTNSSNTLPITASYNDTLIKEVNVFLKSLQAQAELCGATGVDVNPLLATSISNVICSIVMSVRFSNEDPQFKRFMHLIDEGFKLFETMAVVNFLPFVKYLPGLRETRKTLSKNRVEMGAYFQEKINEHRTTFDASNIRDMLDSYLFEIEKAKMENRSDQLFNGKNHDRQMQQIIGDLFSTGMETIKNTLQWSLVYMMHYPAVAKAVQDELDTVVGRNRLPTLEDMPNTQYTEATILETLRRSSVVALGTIHAVTRDVKFNGFTIPKNTQIVPLLHAVHMDPELWESPEDFRPTRFLTPEGKVTKPEFFLPFGVGRRMCLGDVLARMELFLFFSTLMHTFGIESPPGQPLPSLKGNAGVTITPDSHKVKAATFGIMFRIRTTSGVAVFDIRIGV
ncbi:cytochrome P450 18a1 [Diaphorina citri]|uniref:Cytochrome P450 18a1 n=1 Tax=Diaphorina citri TaxID=121845 RepID=A0A3Q0J293_DIACI|nr:cytochrome P450 18a1 [Diaphorina citri]